MEMAGAEGGNVPKSYSLNMFKDFVPMSVFSETNQGKVSIEGKVEHKFDMKPHGENIEEYGKLCRERTNKSMIKSRQIQVIDNDRGVHMRPMPGMIGFISSTSKVSAMSFSSEQCAFYEFNTVLILLHVGFCYLSSGGGTLPPAAGGGGWFDTSALPGPLFGSGECYVEGCLPCRRPGSIWPMDKKKTAPVKQSDVKRTRRDRGELEDIMFKLFERQPNWALKQLVQETDQPAQFLKEILNELCVYNKRGTNQGTYELKPEYKKSVEDTTAE
ncbi:General transcription factor IIF subunit 2 [Morella rubra]|uniref:General transcription factor IIF subunit 2 n=1 Tax=Morella rubra TaxID=262757 RepID=A0A6A1UUF2_9ROSI|nr:General transcription factor IIF subunit 2 [Morella rubra]